MQKIFFPILLLVLLSACANIVAPSGGDRDTVAPKVKKATPQNFTTFFEAKEIKLQFDELIEFSNAKNEVIITPVLKKKPIYKQVGNQLKIKFQEKLQANTTYQISFGESIKDYNEGNTIKDLKYIFSTGAYIDSLSIGGSTLNTFNKEALENILVMLYNANEDSVLLKRPNYIAVSDASGNFVLGNLKAGQYKIGALEDKNMNYIFDQETEKIYFSDKIITLNQDTILKPFYLFENIKDFRKKKVKNEEANHLEISFNKAIETLQLNISNYAKDDIYYFSENKKSIHYWYQDKKEESIFQLNDKQNYQDTFSLKLKNREVENFGFEIDYFKQKEDNKQVELYFPFPIKHFEKENFHLKTKDSTHIIYDSFWSENKQQFNIQFQYSGDSVYLVSKDSSFISFHSIYSKAKVDTLFNFKHKMSTLTLKIDSTKDDLILQLLDKEQEILQQVDVSRETSYTFKDLKEGQYFVRIFKDENKNKIWDSGLFHVKQKAEPTIFFSKEINLKANWEKELEIIF